jgi:hypoxanthine phosphoribosyltransferase
MPGDAKILYTNEDIRRRVEELGREITEDYAGRSPVLISLLKGSTVFLADLFREIRLPVRIDFMAISPYGEASEGARVVRIVKDLDQDIGGEDVVIVEDIVDTGLTLSYLVSTLRSRRPRSIEICTLLDRSVVRIAPLEVRYRGFDCPESFVVGYGLDVDERWRNLPGILTIEDPDALATDPHLLTPFLRGGWDVGETADGDSVAGPRGAR